MSSEEFVNLCIEAESIVFGSSELPYTYNSKLFKDDYSIDNDLLASFFINIIRDNEIIFNTIYNSSKFSALNRNTTRDLLCTICENSIRNINGFVIEDRYISRRTTNGIYEYILLKNETFQLEKTLIIEYSIHNVLESVSRVRELGGIPIAVIIPFDGEEKFQSRSYVEEIQMKIGIPIFSIANIRDLLSYLSKDEDYSRYNAVLKYYNNYCKKKMDELPRKEKCPDLKESLSKVLNNIPYVLVTDYLDMSGSMSKLDTRIINDMNKDLNKYGCILIEKNPEPQFSYFADGERISSRVENSKKNPPMYVIHIPVNEIKKEESKPMIVSNKIQIPPTKVGEPIKIDMTISRDTMLGTPKMEISLADDDPISQTDLIDYLDLRISKINKKLIKLRNKKGKGARIDSLIEEYETLLSIKEKMEIDSIDKESSSKKHEPILGIKPDKEFLIWGKPKPCGSPSTMFLFNTNVILNRIKAVTNKVSEELKKEEPSYVTTASLTGDASESISNHESISNKENVLNYISSRVNIINNKLLDLSSEIALIGKTTPVKYEMKTNLLIDELSSLLFLKRFIKEEL